MSQYLEKSHITSTVLSFHSFKQILKTIDFEFIEVQKLVYNLVGKKYFEEFYINIYNYILTHVDSPII